jgi:hypothetical protein
MQFPESTFSMGLSSWAQSSTTETLRETLAAKKVLAIQKRINLCYFLGIVKDFADQTVVVGTRYTEDVSVHS